MEGVSTPSLAIVLSERCRKCVDIEVHYLSLLLSNTVPWGLTGVPKHSLLYISLNFFTPHMTILLFFQCSHMHVICMYVFINCAVVPDG